MQQGTRFVHKGLHIFIPVLHHLFSCVLFYGEGLQMPESILPPFIISSTRAQSKAACTTCASPKNGLELFCSFSLCISGSRAQWQSNLPLQEAHCSTSAVIGGAQVHSWDWAVSRHPLEGDSMKQHLLFHPNIFPLFWEAKAPILIWLPLALTSAVLLVSAVLLQFMWCRWEKSPTKVVFTCKTPDL